MNIWFDTFERIEHAVLASAKEIPLYDRLLTILGWPGFIKCENAGSPSLGEGSSESRSKNQK